MSQEIQIYAVFFYKSLNTVSDSFDWFGKKVGGIKNKILRMRNGKYADLISDRRINEMRKKVRPIFVLSPGRSGTNTLTALLKLSPYIDSFHEPVPNMFNLSYLSHMTDEGINQTFWHEIFKVERNPLIFKSEINGKTYFESNNRMTFLANYLSAYYPLSKFIYMYRHPYHVIRSFMRRGYYKNHWLDYSRIIPTKTDQYYDQWRDMNLLEKCAWNWNKINTFSLDFLKTTDKERQLSIKAEALFEGDVNIINKIFEFVSNNPKPRASKINKIFNKKMNAQTYGSYPHPDKWTAAEIDSIKKIVAETMSILGYE